MNDDDRFGQIAESIARFFGTPAYIIAQTVVVLLWIALNVVALHTGHWDPYPFVFLNLLFSTQAAYAAPLILLAQTRQADREKRRDLADEAHREQVFTSSEKRERQTLEQLSLMHELMRRINVMQLELEEHMREMRGGAG